MTHLTVLGGTGYAGSAIVHEAAARGHQVVSVARRSPASLPEGAASAVGDVTDPVFLRTLVTQTEHLVLALAPRGDMLGRVAEVAEALIPLAREHGVRLGVIGGAGSLRVSPEGPRLIDTEGFPEKFKPEAFEMIGVWESLQDSEEDLDWYYVSPAAGFGAYNPGTRTGVYRSDDSGVLLTDAEGASNLSAEDLAVAILDEVERPRHRRSRFAVAY